MTDGVGNLAVGAGCRIHTAKMAYGPHAVGQHHGQVIFVRGGAPHEVVDVRIREARRRFAFADVEQVVEPSVARRQPPCPYLPRCGGCPWQHLDYATQAAAKAANVVEQLRRIGGVEVTPAPILLSPREFGYRHRLKLRVQGGGVGFYAGASHDLVEISNCLLAAPPLAAGIPIAADLAARLRTPLDRIELLAVADDESGIVLHAQSAGAWVAADDDGCRAWQAAQANVRGLVLQGRGWRRVWGDDGIAVSSEPDLRLIVHAGTFTQVNAEANHILVATVLRQAAIGPGSRVLDLYAGAGNLSLPLTRRGARVVAVEHDAQAVHDGVTNAQRLGMTGCRFVRARAADALRTATARGEAFDLVILDPPRSGAADVLPHLLQAAPPRIIYVSCDPTSLARDVRQITTRYRIDMLQPIDMFPHTYHVETVMHATLSC